MSTHINKHARGYVHIKIQSHTHTHPHIEKITLLYFNFFMPVFTHKRKHIHKNKAVLKSILTN